MNSRYEIVIFWSDDDERFVAEVPELPGCMADGTTYQDALAQAERAIEDWIETALDLGRQIPKPRRHIA
jgi:predicted RNase H-like HicB family nuclease